MSQINSIEGSLQYTKGKFAIVCARFNGFVVESLLAGAVDTLKRSGVAESDITVVKTPGAFEIPVVVQGLAQLAVDRPAVRSVDINPLIVVDGRPIAVDALVELDAEGGR